VEKKKLTKIILLTTFKIINQREKSNIKNLRKNIIYGGNVEKYVITLIIIK